MSEKDYHLEINQPGNLWWMVGKQRGKFHNQLPDRWIHVSRNSYAERNGEPSWEVHAPVRINPDTVDGHFLFFNSKSEALSFVKKYMREN